MNKKIGFIGAGRMAQAIAGGIASCNASARFVIVDPNSAAQDRFRDCVRSAMCAQAKRGTERAVVDCENPHLAGNDLIIEAGGHQPQINSTNIDQQVIVVPSAQDVFDQCQTVLLAVKPQYFVEALKGLRGDDDSEWLVVSVMAGVTISRIRELTRCKKIIRTMPNTPCLVGQGAIGMCHTESVSPSEFESVRSMFESLGLVATVDETLLDAVTGLSGSGPAYVFQFVESMTRGGIAAGLPADIADQLSRQTVLGAATMLSQLGTSPPVLREQVTSPGGTTLAGLNQLAERGFDTAIVQAILAATARSKELSHL
jgi:pyrroline-5-carboxylate reductase